MKKDSGYLVETKSGKKGRTYRFKGPINEKIPVYLEISKFKYSEKAILCNPNAIKVIGFID